MYTTQRGGNHDWKWFSPQVQCHNMNTLNPHALGREGGTMGKKENKDGHHKTIDTERGGESVLSCSLLIFTLQNKLLAVLIYILTFNLNHNM